MKEVVVTYQCGSAVKEIGIDLNCEAEIVQEVLNEPEENYIRFHMIDGKEMILSKDTIISITGRE